MTTTQTPGISYPSYPAQVAEYVTMARRANWDWDVIGRNTVRGLVCSDDPNRVKPWKTSPNDLGARTERRRVARTERACADAACATRLGRARRRTSPSTSAVACIAQLAGVPAAEAVKWVRASYDPKAVEMPWQRRYVERFAAS